MENMWSGVSLCQILDARQPVEGSKEQPLILIYRSVFVFSLVIKVVCIQQRGRGQLMKPPSFPLLPRTATETRAKTTWWWTSPMR